MPYSLETVLLSEVNHFANAIEKMLVRGAGLIGSTAAWGMYVSTLHQSEQTTRLAEKHKTDATKLIKTRPTAVNLKWAVDQQLKAIVRFATCLKLAFKS